MFRHTFMLRAFATAKRHQGALATMALLSFAPTTLAVTSSELERTFLDDARCHDEVLATLNGKGAYRRNFTTTLEWTKTLARRTDGSVTLMSPTTVAGLWTQVRRFGNGEVEVSFVTTHFTKTVRFDVNPTDRSRDNCKNATLSAVERKLDSKRQKRGFTDRDLDKLVKDNPAGVIYTWSPGMPFSYSSKAKRNGVALIKAAVAELTAELQAPVKLDFVVDPTVKDALVQGVLAKESVEMDASMGRSIQALDLLFRNMNQHYPAILVYANGKLARQIYPGVETLGKYKDVIRATIHELQGGGTAP